jgi:hypothetical protein
LLSRELFALVFVGSSLFSACSGDDKESANNGGDQPGSQCEVNADCAGTDAAAQAMTLKCPKSEVYCLDGECLADCATECTVVRSDVNPCSEGTCATGPFGLEYCTMLPVKCADPSDCPRFTPSGEGEWRCEDGVCQHDDWSYPTR